MTAAPAKPAAPRRGALTAIGRWILTLVVVLACTALAVATWANWRRDGRVTFRVFDPVWWGVGKREAEPYVDGARTAANKAYDSVGDLIGQAEAWLKERKAEPQPATPPVSPTTPASSEAAAHEAAFVEAQNRFSDGLIAYRKAQPRDPGEQPNPKAQREAEAAFVACRDLIAKHLGPYRALRERNDAILAKTEDLQRLNLRMLDDTRRLGIPP